MSFAMTMLSWSAVEYEAKYRALNEYGVVRDRIRWGTDYLLRTFDNNATTVDSIYSQVGGSPNGSRNASDQYCWQRPEQMDYPRPVQTALHGPDLAGEMAAALAAASIVFRDDAAYSKRLVDGAEAVFSFARRKPYIEPYYNSTGFFDELMWGAAWLYCATGKTSYLAMATDVGISRDAKALSRESGLRVLGWDNKEPAVTMLLTRAQWFVDLGYPYEDMLRNYQHATEQTMCSYMARFHAFNFNFNFNFRSVGPVTR